MAYVIDEMLDCEVDHREPHTYDKDHPSSNRLGLWKRHVGNDSSKYSRLNSKTAEEGFANNRISRGTHTTCIYKPIGVILLYFILLNRFSWQK